MNFGCLNIQGKSTKDELLKELNAYEMDVVVLSETKKKKVKWERNER